jgi:hypothetical protein
MPPYAFAEWSAEQIRLTAFALPGAANPMLERWWEAIVGTPPDEATTNLKMGLRTLAGSFHTGKLILKLELNRIDWLFVPQGPDPATGLSGEFPSLGPIHENLKLFTDITERWLNQDDIPDLVRIAFGAIVTHPEPDRRSAYLRLPDYLPLRIDPESTDFNLQINVPSVTRTGIDGLRINRLSRWAIMGLARVAFQAEGGGIGATTSQYVNHALRVEVDINTSGDLRTALPRERLIDLYRELVAFGRDILTVGLQQ